MIRLPVQVLRALEAYVSGYLIHISPDLLEADGSLRNDHAQDPDNPQHRLELSFLKGLLVRYPKEQQLPLTNASLLPHSWSHGKSLSFWCVTPPRTHCL